MGQWQINYAGWGSDAHGHDLHRHRFHHLHVRVSPQLPNLSGGMGVTLPTPRPNQTTELISEGFARGQIIQGGMDRARAVENHQMKGHGRARDEQRGRLNDACRSSGYHGCRAVPAIAWRRSGPGAVLDRR